MRVQCHHPAGNRSITFSLFPLLRLQVKGSPDETMGVEVSAQGAAPFISLPLSLFPLQHQLPVPKTIHHEPVSVVAGGHGIHGVTQCLERPASPFWRGTALPPFFLRLPSSSSPTAEKVGAAEAVARALQRMVVEGAGANVLKPWHSPAGGGKKGHPLSPSFPLLSLSFSSPQ